MLGSQTLLLLSSSGKRHLGEMNSEVGPRRKKSGARSSVSSRRHIHLAARLLLNTVQRLSNVFLLARFVRLLRSGKARTALGIIKPDQSVVSL